MVFWKRLPAWVAVVILMAAFAVQGLLSASRESATSDEIPHLAAGYSYLRTGDYRLNFEHPPLVKLIAAVPLLAFDLDFNRDSPAWKTGSEWAFGEELINANRVAARTIVFWGRVPMLVLAVLLGLMVFKWASEIYGLRGGLLALALYAFCPNMLANGPLVTLDVPDALFILISIYTFHHLLLKPDVRHAIYAGVALGMALSSKTTALSLLPLYLLLTVVFLGRGTKGLTLAQAPVRAAIMLAAAAAIIVATYRVTSISRYFDSLKYFVSDVGAGGRPAYLFGHYSLNGWWYYFLAAILVKTPVAFLVMIAIAFASFARVKPSLVELFLVISVVFFLMLASLSRLQLGLRYVLQIYPLLFILTGGRIATAVRRVGEQPAPSGGPRRKVVALVLAGFMVWYVVGTVLAFPHYLAYFNELVGGSKNGYKYLLDSNLDWGQDLPSLASFLDRSGRPEVVLSFFGTASPGTYGITYQDFFSYNRSGRREEHTNSAAPRQEVFVVSANLLECLFIGDKHYYDWLKQKHPLATPGHSLFVYDITNDADAHLRLGVAYLSANLLKKAEREFRRVLVIDPASAQAKAYLEAMRQRAAGLSSG
ncbi:MAG TPA: glycosyltransferase family 39 protein [bacterium]|nr:glycosyltransferase family 39 protein [bacterium]